jgi:hypothetical protein
LQKNQCLTKLNNFSSKFLYFTVDSQNSGLEGTEFLDCYFERTAKSRKKIKISNSLGPKIWTVKRRGPPFRESTVPIKLQFQIYTNQILTLPTAVFSYIKPTNRPSTIYPTQTHKFQKFSPNITPHSISQSALKLLKK